MWLDRKDFLDKVTNYFDYKKFTSLTEVQKKVMPLLSKNKNVFVEAPTGTGKTLSFLLPALYDIDYELNSVQAIIFVPTRELGKQIGDVLSELKKFIDIKFFLALGGTDIDEQNLKHDNLPQIIIANPVRLTKLFKANQFSFQNIKHIVVDEADMCLEFGFLEYINDFFQKIDFTKTTISMFSATFPIEIQNFIKKQIKESVTNILIPKNDSPVDNYLVLAYENQKNSTLINLIDSSKFNPYLAMFFVKSNDEGMNLYKFLKNSGIKKVGLYTSDLTPRERAQVMKHLKNGEIIYFITTDVMARGIDIEGVTHVVNYSLPTDLSFYRHRIGRTNRGKNTGFVFTFYNNSNSEDIKRLKQQNSFINFIEFKDF